MSKSYIDLMDDMHLSNQSMFKQYYDRMTENNISAAQNIISSNPDVQNQITNSENVNYLISGINNEEITIKTDIDYFLDTLLENFQKLIDDTIIKGTYNVTVQYYSHNLVYYQDKAYYAISNPPVGTLPTDTNYWIEYDIKGYKGYGGINLNFKYNWDSSLSYTVGDIVIFKNKLWYAVADNTNYEPNLNHYPWVIVTMPKMAVKTPIQKATPDGYDTGDLWFEITVGDDVIQTIWGVRPSEPTPRFASAAFTIDNIIYVVGGILANFQRTNINEAYDILTGTWSVKANSSVIRARNAGFSIGTNGYNVGGIDENGNILSLLEMYDSITNSWSTKTSYPIPIISSAVATSTLGYVVGGETTQNILATKSYSYNPNSDTWIEISSKPTETYGHTLATDGNTIFAIGGINSNEETLGINEAYNISTNTWSQKDTLSVPRSFLGSFIQSGTIYAIGGLNSDWYSLDVSEKYDIANDNWETDMPLNYPRSSLNALVANGNGFAIGGIDIGVAAIKGYVEQYDVTSLLSNFEMIIDTSLNTTTSKSISIPMVQDGTYDYWIDWGDGNISSEITTYNDINATHTYTSDGEYTIKLMGTLSQLKYTGNIATCLKEITKCIISFSSIIDMFKNCLNLTTLVDGIFQESTGVDSAENVFYNCQNLTSLPSGIFANNINITSYENTFANSGITTIPNDLFSNSSAVINFNSTFKNCIAITKIPDGLLNNNVYVQDFSEIFSGCTGLTILPNNLFLNTNSVTTFANAFNGCSNLTSLPINLFNVNPMNATNYSGMFQNTNISTIPVSFLQNATMSTNYNNLFFNSGIITEIPDNCFNGNNATWLEAFNILNIKTLGNNSLNGLNITSDMFKNATNLETCGDNVFWSSSGTQIANAPTDLFNGCSKLTSIGNMNLNGVNVSANLNNMFKGCTALTTLSGFMYNNNIPSLSNDISFADCPLTWQSLINIYDSATTNTPTTIKNMTLGSANLSKLDDTYKLAFINKYWNLVGYTPNITSEIARNLVYYLYGDDETVASTDTTETSLYIYVKLVSSSNPIDYRAMYAVDKTTGLVYESSKIPINEYWIYAGTNSESGQMFYVSKGENNDTDGTLLKAEINELAKSTSTNQWLTIGTNYSSVINPYNNGLENIQNAESLFMGLSTFKGIEILGNWAPTNINSLFNGCSNLSTINLGNLNTANFTSMTEVFKNCVSLADFSSLSSIDTSKITNMNGLFYGCSKLTKMININMSKVTNASNMYRSTGLTSITGGLLSNSIQNASGLFSFCTALNAFPSNYTTIFGNNSNLTNVSSLFEGCTKLSIYVDNNPISYGEGTITIDSAKQANQILRYCPNVTNASRIFAGCTSLAWLPIYFFYYSTNLTNVSYAFSGCSNMAEYGPETGVDVIMLHNNTKLTDISYFFERCTKMISFISTTGYFGYGAYDTLTQLENAAGFFKDSGANSMLFDVGLPTKSPKLKNISYFYSGCKDLYNIPFGTEVATNMPILQNCTGICYNCSNINIYGDVTGDKVYANNVIYPIAQLTSITGYANAFTNCSKLTDYANLPMGWRAGSTSVQNPNNIAIALAKIAWGISPESYNWSVTSYTGNEYNVSCRDSSTHEIASYTVNVQTGKVVEH